MAFFAQDNGQCVTGPTVELFLQVKLFKTLKFLCIPDICTTKYYTIDVRCFLEEDEIDEETLENFTFVVEVSENLCKAILCLKKFGTKIAVILIGDSSKSWE